MKYRIEKITVSRYASGAREGEWRTFELPEGAIVLTARETWLGSDIYSSLHITYAVAA